MMAFLLIISILFLARGDAQPQIAPNAVLNAASSAPIGSPNSSIAQGSIFSVYGLNLGPTSSPAQSYPLQPTLGGVSVQVSSAGTTESAFPIFVSPNLVNAILPGGTPLGTASLTVTYNGQPSNTVTFQVVANSFGIFTLTSNGQGAGIVTNPNYQVYSDDLPANPGNTATIWGTGIGASPGDDGTAPPQQIDMPNLPLFVYVGTQAATVTYRGRAAFTGEDQINFVVPAGIVGCYVPIAVLIGDTVSNFATMPIAQPGQVCPDPAPPVPTLANPSSTPTGDILLIRTTTVANATTTADYVQAFFGDPQIVAFPYAPPIFGNPYTLPIETCTGGVTFPSFIDVLANGLDAGPLNITGPNGSIVFPASGVSVQLGGGAGNDAPPLYLSAGSYTVTGAGGTGAVASANVGPFSVDITVPPPLIWTNQVDIATIDRASGVDITWTGGDPNGTVQISGDVGFICNAKVSDQHFTIPPFVLLSYPPSATSTGYLSLGAASTTPFSATGIVSGTINSVYLILKNVSYQ